MDEMSSAVSVTLSLGNSMCDESGIATHVEITRLKLVTDASNLLLDPAKVVSAESVSSGNGNCNDVKSELHGLAMSAPEGSGGGGDDLSGMLPDNGNGSIAEDVVMQESEEDGILSVAHDTNGIIRGELLTLDVESEIRLPDIEEIEKVGHAQIVAKAIILVESSIGQVPSGELIVAAVSPDSKISSKSDIKASTVVFQSHMQKNVSKGGIRSVFELDCIPLWGSVSIPGDRPEMEDAIAAVPRFMKIPIKMLIGDRAQLVMAMAIPFFQQVTGINVISFYAPVLFRTMGLAESASLFSAIVIRAVATVSTITSMLIVDKLGRRALFMIGGVQMFLSQIIIGGLMAAQLGDHGGINKGYATLIIIFICIYVSGFAWSWGPLAWLVPSEIFPLEIRSAGQSITVAVSFLFIFISAQTFLTMLCHFKSGIFFFFGGWVMVMTAFVYLLLPETKNMPIEQMSEVWREHWFWWRIVGEVTEDRNKEAP